MENCDSNICKTTDNSNLEYSLAIEKYFENNISNSNNILENNDNQTNNKELVDVPDLDLELCFSKINTEDSNFKETSEVENITSNELKSIEETINEIINEKSECINNNSSGFHFLQTSECHTNILENQNTCLQITNIQDINIQNAFAQNTGIECLFVPDIIPNTFVQDTSIGNAFVQDVCIKNAFVQDAIIENAYITDTNLENANEQVASVPDTNNIQDTNCTIENNVEILLSENEIKTESTSSDLIACFECTFCKQYFNNKEQFRKHAIQTHNSASVYFYLRNIMKCKYCNFKFSIIDSKFTHKCKIKNLNNTIEIYSYKCSNIKCRTIFYTKEHCEKHIKEMHSSSTNNNNEHVISELNNLLQCNDCFKLLRNGVTLIAHKKEVCGRALIPCNICQVWFKKTHEYDEHMVNTHSNIFPQNNVTMTSEFCYNITPINTINGYENNIVTNNYLENSVLLSNNIVEFNPSYTENAFNINDYETTYQTNTLNSNTTNSNVIVSGTVICDTTNELLDMSNTYSYQNSIPNSNNCSINICENNQAINITENSSYCNTTLNNGIMISSSNLCDSNEILNTTGNVSYCSNTSGIIMNSTNTRDMNEIHNNIENSVNTPNTGMNVIVRDFEPKFLCSSCNETFKNRYECVKHITSVHKTISVNLYIKKLMICNHCKLIFQDSDVYQNHICRNNHDDNIVIIFVYHCPTLDCDEVFNVVEDCEKHIIEKHTSISNVITKLVTMYHCDRCYKLFLSENTYSCHALFLCGKAPLFCGICEIIFKKESELEEHIQTLHFMPYLNNLETNTNDQNDDTEESTNNSMKRNHDEAFKTTNDVEKNSKKYTHRKDSWLKACFLCSLCKKCFDNRKLFVEHTTEVHNNVSSKSVDFYLKNLLQCKECKLKFDESDSNLRHVCKYKNNKNSDIIKIEICQYYCPFKSCKWNFNTVELCKKHMKDKHKKNKRKPIMKTDTMSQCNNCFKLLRPWNLKGHRAKCSTFPLNCSICQIMFRKKCDLDLHVKKIHSNVSVSEKTNNSLNKVSESESINENSLENCDISNVCAKEHSKLHSETADNTSFEDKQPQLMSDESCFNNMIPKDCSINTETSQIISSASHTIMNNINNEQPQLTSVENCYNNTMNDCGIIIEQPQINNSSNCVNMDSTLLTNEQSLVASIESCSSNMTANIVTEQSQIINNIMESTFIAHKKPKLNSDNNYNNTLVQITSECSTTSKQIILNSTSQVDPTNAIIIDQQLQLISNESCFSSTVQINNECSMIPEQPDMICTNDVQTVINNFEQSHLISNENYFANNTVKIADNFSVPEITINEANAIQAIENSLCFNRHEECISYDNCVTINNASNCSVRNLEFITTEQNFNNSKNQNPTELISNENYFTNIVQTSNDTSHGNSGIVTTGEQYEVINNILTESSIQESTDLVSEIVSRAESMSENFETNDNALQSYNESCDPHCEVSCSSDTLDNNLRTINFQNF